MDHSVAQSEWRVRHSRLISTRRYLWIAFAIAIAIVWFAAPRMVNDRRPLPVGQDRYDPSLRFIDSLTAAQAALPRYITHTGHPQKDIADGIQRMLSERFVHGFPRFSARQNWILSVIGQFTRALGDSDDGTSSMPVVDSPLLPNDILKYRRAMCTQQMLVFEALLARNGINYARVSFMRAPAHDAVAAKVDGVWRYYDSDKETTEAGVPLVMVLQGDVLQAMYPEVEGSVNLGQHFRDLAREHQVVVRDVDHFPAPRGALFQRFTELVSQWGWLIPLGFAAWLSSSVCLARYRRVRRSKAGIGASVSTADWY